MGIKLYSAYRLKHKHLTDFQRAVAQASLDDATSYVVELINALTDAGIEMYLGRANVAQSATRMEKLVHLYFALVEHFEKSAIDPRAPVFFRLQAGWNLYANGGYYYAVCWGRLVNERSAALKAALSQMSWLEEYGYWDAAPPLDSVSRRAWKERQRIWNLLYGENEYQRRLSFLTVDFTNDHPSGGVILHNILHHPGIKIDLDQHGIKSEQPQ